MYREPELDPAALYGGRYRIVQRLERTDVVSPLALPSVRVAVAALLP